MRLDWELLDLNQNILARLDNRRAGGRIELAVNSYRQASLPLALEDPARNLATSMDTLLRATLTGDNGFSRILFIGRITIPEAAGEHSNENLTLNATDALMDLDAKVIATRTIPGEAIVTSRNFRATEQSTIMWTLINESAITSIEQGTFQGTIVRDRVYYVGKSIGEALTEMSEVIDGPDFELEPIIRTDGVTHRFNTLYPRQGQDLTGSIRFAYGQEPFTATGFTHSPGGAGGPITNQVVAVGVPNRPSGSGPSWPSWPTQPGYIAKHQGSIDQYGTFEQYLALDDVSEVATLQDHAEGLVTVSAFPIDYFTVTTGWERVTEGSGVGVPPAFGRDYWIGDTIGVDATMPDGETVELAGRITDAVIVEQETGQLAVELTCAPEPSFAGVTGEEVLVIQDGNSS